MNLYLKKRIKLSLVLIIVSISIVTTFLFLDFHLALSTTNSDSQVTGYAFGAPEPDLTNGLNVFVEGNTHFVHALNFTLISELQKQGILVHPVTQLKAQFTRQTLVISTLEMDGLYNPFIPQSNVETFFYYTFDGNTTYYTALKRDESVTVALRDVPNLLIEGRVALTGRMTGIVSYPAYHNYLARELVTVIMNDLTSHISMVTH